MTASTTLSIDRLGRRGDGVARTAEGQTVLVPLTLPGEVVTGEIRDGRIATPVIVTASEDRVTPPCPHYADCGGCLLMHGSDGFVARWKAVSVLTALAAQGIGATVAGIATSPPRSRRRAVLSGRRAKKGVTLGFHARQSDRIVDLHSCHVLRPAILAALPALRDLVAAGASRTAELVLTVTEGPAGLDLAVSGGKPLTPALSQTLAAVAEAADLARLDWDGVPMTRRAPVQRMGRAQVIPPPGAFLQATAEGEAALRAVVRHALKGAARVVDLFAGCGTFALPLAETAEVHAVEGLAPPLAALDQGWRTAQGLKRVTTETRDLAARPLLADELQAFDAVVIDPPRSGAAAQAAQLAALRDGPTRVAWVSCDPVSFARDAKRMIDGGWRMDPIHVVDQFRWSPHVETVTVFRRG